MMIEIKQGVICLGTMVNLQGSYTFMSLKTVQKVTRNQLTEIHTPNKSIHRVTQMSDIEKQ